MEIISGLSETEALINLKKDGFNELPAQRSPNIFQILLNVIKEPMLFLLLISGLIYLLLGDTKDAGMLLFFVIVVIGITSYQERKTERALDALKNLSSPRALVVRDGIQKRIAGREVVIDDIILLREGDRIPADAALIEATNLTLDESLLTGESVPVVKKENDQVFSGTLVTLGRGIAKVHSIGNKTELGKIGKSLENIKEEDTLLKKETGVIVRNFAIAGIGLCLIVILIYGYLRGNWLNGFLAGLTLSMAMLPEEFSVVLLIFLTLGAWRISKSKVLTRNTSAIETLGAATALCVDKTGTLTLNKMHLTDLYAKDSTVSLNRDINHSQKLSEKFHQLLEFAYLSSQINPFDPIEKEIKMVTLKLLSKTRHIHKNWKLVKEYPLSPNLMAISHVWESVDRNRLVIAAKGAPEAIFDLCHLDKSVTHRLEEKIKVISQKGLRILGVARSYFQKSSLPKSQHDYHFEFIGLLGFSDPVRPDVPHAVKECQTAGIKIYMMTGDYQGTAEQVGKIIGLPKENIFARMKPREKLNIIDVLKSKGEIVAMTGDGVNDSPALKSAHIGIAMGERGTDVAREAADLVLLNDDFSSIVDAIKVGRRIFDNLKKAMVYILAIHIPIAGISIIPVLFNMPVVLMPAHIAFLELIIDPACSIVFESQPEEKDIMKRPPRNLKIPLFDKKTVFFSALQGLGVLSIITFIFLTALNKGLGEQTARTLTFTTLVFSNLALIITNLSWKENLINILRGNNKILWIVLLGTVCALFIIIYIPLFNTLFHFSFIKTKEMMITFFAALLGILWFEIVKFLSRYLVYSAK